jgi:phosphoribosylamine--glycine ligase
VTPALNVLLIDHSGRGHATADLFVRTRSDVFVHYAPGCAGVKHPRIRSYPSCRIDDPGPLVALARELRADLVYVSNPVSVVTGMVDHFRAAGFRTVGPTRTAARIESSKVEAKELFVQYGIPTPSHRAFSDVEEARRFIATSRRPLVVKADGMSGGNGAYVCDGRADALTAVDGLMVQRLFGEAGDRIVIEDRHYGPEASYFALVDRKTFLPLPMAADYPKAEDGNRGVDTAGMGAFSPHPLASAALTERIEREIMKPVMQLIADRDLDYRGPIYLGLLIEDDRPLLLEINARMGDPEAEVIFPRLESDYYDLCLAMEAGTLAQHSIRLNDRVCCTISLTQGRTRSGLPGWPYGAFDRGHLVSGTEVDDPEVKVFLGQATLRDGVGLCSDGPRVAQVCGFGRTLEQASAAAYRHVGRIDFEGIRYRGDIGRRMPWDVADA